MSSEHPPSLKRPLSTENSSDASRSPRRPRIEYGSTDDLATLDTRFYMEDGDCFIRVDNYLFKIHRYHLTRGGATVFKDMFLVPSEEEAMEGVTSRNPIVLSGDSPDNFRSFLAIAYAEPLEFQTISTQVDNLPQFIGCAIFSHKYNIAPLSLAALRVIVDLTDRNPILDLAVYLSLFDLADLCADVEDQDGRNYKDAIRTNVQWGWTNQILLDPPPFEQLSDVLDAADKYRLRGLGYTCSIYLRELQYAAVASREASLSSDDTSPFQNQAFLKPSHRLRILSGAWSLEHFWAKFIQKAPIFPDRHTCQKPNHSTTCLRQWDKAWLAAVRSQSVTAVPCALPDDKLYQLKTELDHAFENTCIGSAFGANFPGLFWKAKSRVDHFVEPEDPTFDRL